MPYHASVLQRMKRLIILNAFCVVQFLLLINAIVIIFPSKKIKMCTSNLKIGLFRLRSYHQKEIFMQIEYYTETGPICQQIMKIYEGDLSDPRSP